MARKTIIEERIDRLTERGWFVSIHSDADGHVASANIGDSNCPHSKRYDPSDGHGYSSIEIMTPAHPTDLRKVVEELDEACRDEEALFGESYVYEQTNIPNTKFDTPVDIRQMDKLETIKEEGLNVIGVVVMSVLALIVLYFGSVYFFS